MVVIVVVEMVVEVIVAAAAVVVVGRQAGRYVDGWTERHDCQMTHIKQKCLRKKSFRNGTSDMVYEASRKSIKTEFLSEINSMVYVRPFQLKI